MVKRHLKRINAPKTWKIQRRGIKFTVKSNPGGLPHNLSMSISNVLKHELGIVSSTKEVKHVVLVEDILVNGRKVKDYRFPVGFTDTVSIPKVNKYYRMIIGTDGILKPLQIEKEEAGLKIAKIVGKSLVKGKIQLNLFDGRNIFFEKQHYKVKDSVFITIPDVLVKEHLSFEKGALVLLYQGKHIGKLGKIENIKGTSIVVKSDGETFETKRDFALVVGKDKPLVKMTE